jgi:hypothetical protein
MEHGLKLSAPTTHTPSVNSIDNIGTTPRASNITPARVKTEPAPSTALTPSGVRCSTRETTGRRQITCYDDAFIAKAKTFVTSDEYESTLVYKKMQTDFDTGHVDIQYPHIYVMMFI